VEDESNFFEIGDIEGESPIMVGRAHKGMVDAAKSVARITGKIISIELRAESDCSLVIVGHSLGGGVAGESLRFNNLLPQDHTNVSNSIQKQPP
jgi:hypothetical protein